MCLGGGEQVDVSQYVPLAVSTIELEVILSSITGALLV
jgi:hypothetical protein